MLMSPGVGPDPHPSMAPRGPHVLRPPIANVRRHHQGALSPSGHGVVSIPIRVLYSHAGPVGTAKDLSSQTTKSKYHVIHQVIQVTCKVT